MSGEQLEWPRSEAHEKITSTLGTGDISKLNGNTLEDTPAIITAAYHNLADLVEPLCVSGADINIYREGWTALMHAVGRGFPNVVAFLRQFAHVHRPAICDHDK